MDREKIKKLISDYGSSLVSFGMDLGSPLKNPVEEICDDFDNQVEELNLQRIREITDAQDAGYKVTEAMQKKIDDIESRICESCKCKSNPAHVHGYLCENKKSVAYQSYVSADGGCNKWEAKA